MEERINVRCFLPYLISEYISRLLRHGATTFAFNNPYLNVHLTSLSRFTASLGYDPCFSLACVCVHVHFWLSACVDGRADRSWLGESRRIFERWSDRISWIHLFSRSTNRYLLHCLSLLFCKLQFKSIGKAHYFDVWTKLMSWAESYKKVMLRLRAAWHLQIASNPIVQGGQSTTFYLPIRGVKAFLW